MRCIYPRGLTHGQQVKKLMKATKARNIELQILPCVFDRFKNNNSRVQGYDHTHTRAPFPRFCVHCPLFSQTIRSHRDLRALEWKASDDTGSDSIPRAVIVLHSVFAICQGGGKSVG